MAKSFDDLAARTMTRRQRERAQELARRDLSELLLSEIRKLRGMSQKELADRLDIRQPSLSKLEGQDDMQVSTLKKIVEALGGHLRITATFPRGDVGVKLSGKGKSARVHQVRELELV
jgi:transcriptional regulator with XRE-family HTH domain